ncbi:MAG: beta-ketoacyl-[acyl-carrier-protein] synthase family protein [Pirellulaceae bacterium]
MISSDEQRVAITGLGLISPLGNTPGQLHDSLMAGSSGVGPFRRYWNEEAPIRFGAEAWDFEGKIEDFGLLADGVKKAIRKGLKLMCREIQMGVASAQRAIADARLEPATLEPSSMGVVFGCDHLLTSPEEFVAGFRTCMMAAPTPSAHWGDRGLGEVTPLWLLKYLPNMPASHIAIYNDMRGPSNSLTYREASSNISIAESVQTIRRGSAQVMLAGATGGCLHPWRMLQLAMQYQLADAAGEPGRASRPFDHGRTGAVLGEGAATLVLENWEHALARGATIYGEVLGSGSSVALNRNSVARADVAVQNAIAAALRAARLRPEQIDHLHAHGLGTDRADIDEARGIAAVFGPDSRLPVVAAKSYFGNLGAASGLVELMASLLACRSGQLFPTLNYEQIDPACPLAVVTDNQKSAGRVFLNLNVTTMGQAAAVIIRAQ